MKPNLSMNSENIFTESDKKNIFARDFPIIEIPSHHFQDTTWSLRLPSRLRNPRDELVNAQSSYLSQISQIISVEKNLSCGKISDF